MAVDSLDFPTLLEQSMEELRLKTEAHDSLWRLGEYRIFSLFQFGRGRSSEKLNISLFQN